MFRIPNEVEQVSVIFMFLNRPDLAPTMIPPSHVLPVKLDRPKDSRLKSQPPSPFRDRISLAELGDTLRAQDFALVILDHGSAIRPSGDVEYACKFAFRRGSEAMHEHESLRLTDLDGLTRHTLWSVRAEFFGELHPMLKILCSSPWDVEMTQPARRAG